MGKSVGTSFRFELGGAFILQTIDEDVLKEVCPYACTDGQKVYINGNTYRIARVVVYPSSIVQRMDGHINEVEYGVSGTYSTMVNVIISDDNEEAAVEARSYL